MIFIHKNFGQKNSFDEYFREFLNKIFLSTKFIVSQIFHEFRQNLFANRKEKKIEHD